MARILGTAGTPPPLPVAEPRFIGLDGQRLCPACWAPAWLETAPDGALLCPGCAARQRRPSGPKHRTTATAGRPA